MPKAANIGHRGVGSAPSGQDELRSSCLVLRYFWRLAQRVSPQGEKKRFTEISRNPAVPGPYPPRCTPTFSANGALETPARSLSVRSDSQVFATHGHGFFGLQDPRNCLRCQGTRRSSQESVKKDSFARTVADLNTQTWHPRRFLVLSNFQPSAQRRRVCKMSDFLRLSSS